MGVKGLWSVLEPTGKQISLQELAGKTVAIDLSCWVCSSQVLPSHVQKPHLRNLFFKSACLLDYGILPVYVLEGEAPTLKKDTMRKRTEARFQSVNAGKEQSTTRRNYKSIQKECTDLLNAMGIPCVQSCGEAEAMCSALNKAGIVHGCVTEDGDALLYGACTLYRQFSTDPSNFSTSEYSMQRIEKSLNLSREKLIVMAVLVGCDYLPEGVPGVGKESALKLLAKWSKGTCVEKLLFWLSTPCKGFVMPDRPAHCSRCKHPGLLRSHTKNGCTFCGKNNDCEEVTDPGSCTCDWHLNQSVYLEESIRSKINDLPKKHIIKDIIDEFLNGAEQVLPTRFHWERPNLRDLLRIVPAKLGWDKQYTLDKTLPLATRWIVQNPDSLSNKLPIEPEKVIRKKIHRGRPLYVVQWTLKEDFGQVSPTFETTEPREAMERAFPALIPVRLEKPLRKTGARTRSKPQKGQQDIAEMLQKLTLKKKEEVVEESSDSDSDLSVIVDMICSRKENQSSHTHSPDILTKSHMLKVDNVSVLLEDEIQDGDVDSMKLQLGETPKANFSLNLSLHTTDDMSDLQRTPESRLKSHSTDFDDFDFSTPLPLNERIKKRLLLQQ